MTSRGVVNRVHRVVRPAKVGHAGTLDPLATGVLVVAVGRSTKLVPYIQRMQKHYRATFALGQTSDTEDITGKLSTIDVDTPPSSVSVANACGDFVGNIMQRPPAFSALHVKGRRAYDLARNGETVELQPRPIAIHSIDMLSYTYPELTLDIVCGSGTYIRSLGRDIGESLGCGAVMSALQRTAIGKFSIESSLDPESLTIELIQQKLAPPVYGTEQLSTVVVDDRQIYAISVGQKIPLPIDVDELAALSSNGSLVSVMARTPEGTYKPSTNFVAR